MKRINRIVNAKNVSFIHKPLYVNKVEVYNCYLFILMLLFNHFLTIINYNKITNAIWATEKLVAVE